MFPTINKKETGVNLRRIMDMRASFEAVIEVGHIYLSDEACL